MTEPAGGPPRQRRHLPGEPRGGPAGGGTLTAVEEPRRQLADALEDAAYVGVGLAVLGFQRAQVRRRALASAIGREVERLSGWLAAPPDPGEAAGGAGTDGDDNGDLADLDEVADRPLPD